MALRLVALGDSTVEGLMDPGPAGTYVGWADRFAHLLARQRGDVLYANLAVRGQTTTEVLATQVDRAVALRPDLALFVAGINDVLRPRLHRPTLRRNLLTIHERLHRAGASVLTFTVPDMTKVAPAAFVIRSRIGFLNGVVRETGASAHTTVVDLAAEPLAGHPALWHDDRLHASAEGHRRIAAALAEAYGLETEDWRGDPAEPTAAGVLRILAGEARWVAGHLTPWVWGRVWRHEYKTGGRCKRPDLLPVPD